jgi:sodium-dependent dicarboxylate transporter 2/3/5
MLNEMFINSGGIVPTILIIDDEDAFRKGLAQQLRVRNFQIIDTDNPEVVILDQNMPGMDGIQTLKELKKVRPEVQVIMHTGHGGTELARVTGKHDVFRYIEKPCPLDELIAAINQALHERPHALARHEIPAVEGRSFKQWLVGAHNMRPGLVVLGLILFLLISFMPTPKSLQTLLTVPKQGKLGEAAAGYSDYTKMKTGQTISEFYAAKAKLVHTVQDASGKRVKVLIGPEQVAFRAKVMVGTLVVAALFWATGAIPVGITALLVGVLMYFFNVFSPGDVAQAYAKDSVVFIFSVLAIAAAISKTGLDRRIGILLLGTSTNLVKFGLIFAPLLSISASFLSEHALVAFIAPILMMVYMGAIRSAGIQQDKALVVMLMLMLTFCGNVGGPGSPAAGGRNAVMLGIFADYGVQVSFGQWMAYGMPFVPVMSLVIAGYFLMVLRKKSRCNTVNVAAEVRRESEKIGKMTHDEYKAAVVLILLILLWAFFSDEYGMGGPAMLALVALNVMGILRWKDINNIHWDVVALYAAASAMGYGLAASGAALWLASAFVNVLPDFLRAGTGLCISTSFLTGVMTNFMSDGATVAAIGPITVPMATLSGTSAIQVGLATAFASSFAHILIIGTPNNAIVFSMARDPETGEQLITMKDFLIHGSMVFILSLAVLWGWTFLGYWKWFGF